MMVLLKSWWRERSDREQRLLAAMGVLLVVVVGWLGVIRPLDLATAAARERHARAVVALADLQELRDRAAKATNRPQLPLDETLAPFVTRSATDAGMTVERLEAEGAHQVKINISAVRPAAFFGWAQRLEVQHGLVVHQLAAFRNVDTTIAVQLTVRRPAR
jgi:general secretion pathway protein M